MAGISSKAALSSLSAYKYNAGSELEDEGGLNYYNTFYRKYDAQIGRFTGVDMYAGKFAGLNPYQYGANNPILFNDPMGDKFGGANGERLSQMNANPMGSEFGWSYDFGEGGGGGGGGGGGSHSGFDRNGFNASGAAAQQLFAALQNAYNNPKESGEWSFRIGTDNNGNAGFWQPFDIEGGNSAGNGLLSEVKVGTHFVSLSESQGEICPNSFDFINIYGKDDKLGKLNGGYQIAGVSDIRLICVLQNSPNVRFLNLKTLYFGLPILRKNGTKYTNERAQQIAATCVTRAEKDVLDLLNSNGNFVGLNDYFRNRINFQMMQYGGSAIPSLPNINNIINIPVHEATYDDGLFGCWNF